MTGGRLKRVLPYVKDEEAFCFTYGDGLANVDLKALIEFHRQQKKLVTVTATLPGGKFGALQIDSDNVVREFTEKPKDDSRWVNGGFFVLSPKALDYIDGDDTYWEHEPLERLSREGLVSAFKHHGFWQAMDTLHDRALLEDLWNSGEAPWKIW